MKMKILSNKEQRLRWQTW